MTIEGDRNSGQFCVNSILSSQHFTGNGPGSPHFAVALGSRQATGCESGGYHFVPAHRAEVPPADQNLEGTEKADSLIRTNCRLYWLPLSTKRPERIEIINQAPKWLRLLLLLLRPSPSSSSFFPHSSWELTSWEFQERFWFRPSDLRPQALRYVRIVSLHSGLGPADCHVSDFDQGSP